MTTGPPLASPLRRVNTPGLYPKSKLASDWEKWSTTPNWFSTADPPLDPVRYYQEFFCLTPNDKVQEEALERLGREALLGEYNENVSSLFINAVKILKGATPERANIIQTLTVLFQDLLTRTYENTSQDLVLILVGESSRTDQVFTDLVSSLDLILQDSTFQASLRHSTLQLSLLLVTYLGSSPLITYYLRRDLFSSLISFVADESTKVYASEAVLLIGQLATVNGDGKNPYATRIQDFVEEGVMTSIIELVASVLSRSRDSYLSVQDDTPPSFVSSLTSMMFSLNKLLYLPNPFAWNSLPPPPPAYSPPRLDEKIELLTSNYEKRPDLKGKRRATEEEIAQAHSQSEKFEPISTAPTTPGGAPSTPGSINSFNSSHPSIPPRTPTKSPSQRPLLKRSASSKNIDPFTKMPPQSLVVLVSLWEFWKANKTFSSLVFSSHSDQPPVLPSTLISLSSYVLSHAFLSPRSRIYSRLTLNLLTLMVEEAGEGKLCHAEEEKEGEKESKEPQIRMCRQRHPISQHQNVEGKRPIIASLIDSVLLFLRHNMKKTMDVETYVIALRLLQRIMQQLKTEKVKLEYEWVVIWRSILTLSSFVVEHVKELRVISDKVDNLISQIFVTLAYAAYWGEQLLPSQHEQALLYYELLNSDSILSSLSDLLGITTLASNLPSPIPVSFELTASPPQLRGVDPLSPLPRFYFPMPPNTTGNGSVSPTYSIRSVTHYGEGATGTGAGFVATECISNIRSTTTYFQNLITQHAFSLEDESEDPLEPDEILSIIERNLGGVEMIESAAMGDLPRFAGAREKDRESPFERELAEIVRQDTKRLLETDFKGSRP